MDMNWVKVYTSEGQLQAHMIKNFLEACDIHAEIFQESVGVTYGLTVGPLGAVDIYVEAKYEEEALKLLESMENGELDSQNPSMDDQSETEDPAI